LVKRVLNGIYFFSGKNRKIFPTGSKFSPTTFSSKNTKVASKIKMSSKNHNTLQQGKFGLVCLGMFGGLVGKLCLGKFLILYWVYDFSTLLFILHLLNSWPSLILLKHSQKFCPKLNM
jgi:hypothetical protein